MRCAAQMNLIFDILGTPSEGMSHPHYPICIPHKHVFTFSLLFLSLLYTLTQHTHTFTCTHSHTRTHTHMHTHRRHEVHQQRQGLPVHLPAQTEVQDSLQVSLNECVRMCVRVCVCVSVCLCPYICIFPILSHHPLPTTTPHHIPLLHTSLHHTHSNLYPSHIHTRTQPHVQERRP
jgi:hypothetical protein